MAVALGGRVAEEIIYGEDEVRRRDDEKRVHTRSRANTVARKNSPLAILVSYARARQIGGTARVRSRRTASAGFADCRPARRGQVTTGASNDLERVASTAKMMVTRFGMSERVGQVRAHSHSSHTAPPTNTRT